MSQTTTFAALGMASAASTATTYPDTDNQMENGVFSFAKRDDEARVWGELLDLAAPAGPALDVGCGLGAFVAPLRARFAECFFVDRDADRLQAAARAVGESPGEASFFVLDPLTSDAGLAGRFAFIQAIQVLGHLARADAVRMTQTLAAWLAPGGLLLLAVPFTGTPFDLHVITRYVEGMDRPRPHPVSATRFDVEARAPGLARLPVRHFSMASLNALAENAGLVVRETRPYHWFDATTGDLFALLARP